MLFVIATQENRQADSICQTENNMPDNQQGIFYPPYPPTFWRSDGGWWGYYPITPCIQDSNTNSQFYEPYAYYSCEDGNAYVNCPSLNQNNSFHIQSVQKTDIEPVVNNNKTAEKSPTIISITPQVTIYDKNFNPWLSQNNREKFEDDKLNENPFFHNSISEWDTNNLNDCEAKIDMKYDNLKCLDQMRIIVTPCTDDETCDSELESEEDLSKSSKPNNKTALSNSTSTSTSDSDSYLAYSTDPNLKKNCEKSLSSTSIPEDTCGTSCIDFPLDKLNLDSDSDDQEEEYKVEPFQADPTVLNELSTTIYKNEIRKNWRNEQKKLYQSEGDDIDTNTVSVSLPIRFKFSISEKDKDITTVVVEDSTIRSEKLISSKNINDSELHVDFTVKLTKLKNLTIEPEIYFTLRKNSEEVKEVEYKENIETAYAGDEKQVDACVLPSHDLGREHDYQPSNSDESETVKSSSSVESKDSNTTSSDVFYESIVSNVIYDSVISDLDHKEKIPSDKVYDSGIKNNIKPNFKLMDSEKISDDIIRNNKAYFHNEENVRDVDSNSSNSKPKHLLSIQNSREETDDEDSGVTSDMSRIISEVDTDSEFCTSTRKQSKYHRTQTHSRLFRLLNNDSKLTKDVYETYDIFNSRRNDLNLPLQHNICNNNEHHCSNNYPSESSSPEYSPNCENRYRRLHEEINSGCFETTSNVISTAIYHQRQKNSRQDSYYQKWQMPKFETELNIMSSVPHKVPECETSHWAYRLNVLCPRIRSSKNIPKVLKESYEKFVDPSTISFPESRIKNSHC